MKLAQLSSYLHMNGLWLGSALLCLRDCRCRALARSLILIAHNFLWISLHVARVAMRALVALAESCASISLELGRDIIEGSIARSWKRRLNRREVWWCRCSERQSDGCRC